MTTINDGGKPWNRVAASLMSQELSGYHYVTAPVAGCRMNGTFAIVAC